MLDSTDQLGWLLFGLLGNALFASRFVLQWIASERVGRSVVPKAFWYLSIAGSLVLLVYALRLSDPVFVLAYLPNAFIYSRNLVLLRRDESNNATEA